MSYVDSRPTRYESSLDGRWARALQRQILPRPVGGGFGLRRPFGYPDVAEVVVLQIKTDQLPSGAVDWFFGLLRLNDGRFVTVGTNADVTTDQPAGELRSVIAWAAKDLTTMLNENGAVRQLLQDAGIDAQQLLQRLPQQYHGWPDQTELTRWTDNGFFVALALVFLWCWLGDSAVLNQTGMPTNCGALLFAGFLVLGFFVWIGSQTKE